MMQGMTPEMMQAILMGQGGPQDPRTKELERQQQMANMLKKMSFEPQGQPMSGGVAVPTFANSVVGAVGGAMGAKMQPGIDQGVQQQATMQGHQRQAYLQAIIKAMRGGQEQQPTGGPQMPPPPGGFPSGPQAGY